MLCFDEAPGERYQVLGGFRERLRQKMLGDTGVSSVQELSGERLPDPVRKLWLGERLGKWGEGG